MDNRIDVTVPLPGALNDAVETELGYGDSKAEWIREAIKMRLEHEQRSGGGGQVPGGGDWDRGENAADAVRRLEDIEGLNAKEVLLAGGHEELLEEAAEAFADDQ